MSRRDKRQQAKTESRSALPVRDLPATGFLGTQNSTAGEVVNELTALSVATIFAAIQAISCDVAKLPVQVIQLQDNGGRKSMPKHPLQSVLDDPNDEMSCVDFFQAWVGSALLWGTGYAQIVRNGYGQPVQLWPIESYRVWPRRDINQKLYYDVYPGGSWPVGGHQTPAQIATDDMLVLKNFGFNGIQGLAAVRVGKESVGLSIALQKYASSLFGNGARPGGILTTDNILDPEAAKKLVESWNSAHGGAGIQHGTAVLDGKIKWEKVAGTPDESQMTASRMFQVEEVCRLFRIPPQKVQHLVKTAFNSAEQFALEYVSDCLSPWIARIEAEGKKKLVDDPAIRLDLDENALIRADVKTLGDMASQMFINGVWSRNEARIQTGKNPVDGGDMFLNPKASVPVSGDATIEEQQQITLATPAIPPGKEPTTAAPTGATPPTDAEKPKDTVAPPQEDDDTEDDSTRQLQQLGAGIKPLLAEAVRRLLRVETDKITRAAKKDDFATWTEAFYKSHAAHVRAALAPSLQSFATMAGVVSKRDLSGVVGTALPALTERYLNESRSDLTDRDGLEERVAGWVDYRADTFVDSAVEELIAGMQS